MRIFCEACSRPLGDDYLLTLDGIRLCRPCVGEISDTTLTADENLPPELGNALGEAIVASIEAAKTGKFGVDGGEGK